MDSTDATVRFLPPFGVWVTCLCVRCGDCATAVTEGSHLTSEKCPPIIIQGTPVCNSTACRAAAVEDMTTQVEDAVDKEQAISTLASEIRAADFTPEDVAELLLTGDKGIIFALRTIMRTFGMNLFEARGVVEPYYYRARARHMEIA